MIKLGLSIDEEEKEVEEVEEKNEIVDLEEGNMEELD